MKETNEADMLLTPLPAVPKLRHLNDVRRIDSPLPAVPLPPKISRSPNPSRPATNFNRSVSLMSASCDDLRRPPAKPSRNKSNVVKIKKTASVDFDSLSLIPTIMDPFSQELRTNDTNFGAKSYPTNSAAHDYEELIENVRIVHTENSSANINNMNSQVHALPQQASPSIVVSPNHDQLSCDRERQNPMFSGMRPLSPIPNILDSPSFSKIRSPRNVLGPKSACILVAGVIIAILISLISLVIIFMYFLGVLRPINFPDTVDQKSFIDLQNEVNVLRNALLIQGINTNDTISVQRAKISELKTDLFKLNSRKSEVQANEIQEQLESVITSMNSTEVERLFGSMSGRRLPLSHSCRHESFAIGSSAVQDVTDSGEYYADEDYVITGATCSSSAGFIGSMETRQAVVSGVDRNYYKCKCIRIAGSAAPSSGRVECRIDYWQCPLSAV